MALFGFWGKRKETPVPAAEPPIGGQDAGQLLQEGLAAYMQEDYHKALPLFRQAAQAGESQAQFYVGSMYDRSSLIHLPETDDEKAFYWYEKSAQQGYAQAQYCCGALYEAGNGVEYDKKKALQWYQKAAKQGYEPARERCDEMR